MARGIVINDREVADALKRLGKAADAEVAKKALQRTSFEVIDALKQHVTSIFDGPRAWFLAGSFRFKLRKAESGIWTSELGPLRKSANILVRHIDRRTYSPKDTSTIIVSRRKTPAARGGERLRARLQIAVPNKTNIKRGASGKVRKKDTPAVVLGDKGKGFISRDGRMIVVRQHKARKAGLPPLVTYFLVPVAKNPPVFRFLDVAKREAAKWFPIKAREELTKATTRERNYRAGLRGDR